MSAEERRHVPTEVGEEWEITEARLWRFQGTEGRHEWTIRVRCTHLGNDEFSWDRVAIVAESGRPDESIANGPPLTCSSLLPHKSLALGNQMRRDIGHPIHPLPDDAVEDVLGQMMSEIWAQLDDLSDDTTDTISKYPDYAETLTTVAEEFRSLLTATVDGLHSRFLTSKTGVPLSEVLGLG